MDVFSDYFLGFGVRQEIYACTLPIFSETWKRVIKVVKFLLQVRFKYYLEVGHDIQCNEGSALRCNVHYAYNVTRYNHFWPFSSKDRNLYISVKFDYFSK